MAKAKKCTYYHTRVANGFLEASFCFRLKTTERRLIAWILRYTYGEYQEDVKIVATHLAETLKADRSDIGKGLNGLVEKRVILCRESNGDRFYRMCENMNLWKLKCITKERPKLEKLPSENASKTPGEKHPAEAGEKHPTGRSMGEGKTPHSPGEFHPASEVKFPHPSERKPASKLDSDTLFQIYIELERVNGSRKKDFIPLPEAQSSLLGEVAKNDLVDPTIRYLQRWGVTLTNPKPITNWLNVRTESPQEILQALVVGRLLTKDLQRSLKADGKRICADPVAKNLFYAAQHLDEADQPAATTAPKPSRAGLVFFQDLDD